MNTSINKLVGDFDEKKLSRSSKQLENGFILPLFEQLGWDSSVNRIEKAPKNLQGEISYNFCINKEISFSLITGSLNQSSETIHKKILSAAHYAYNKNINWIVYSNFRNTWITNPLWNLNKHQDRIDKWMTEYTDYPSDDSIINILSPNSFLEGRLDRNDDTKRILPIDLYVFCNAKLTPLSTNCH